MQLQAKPGGHHQIAGILNTGGMEQARVHVGGEKDSLRKPLRQCLKYEVLVIEIATQNADGFDWSLAQLLIKLIDTLRQPP